MSPRSSQYVKIILISEKAESILSDTKEFLNAVGLLDLIDPQGFFQVSLHDNQGVKGIYSFWPEEIEKISKEQYEYERCLQILQSG